MKRMSKYENGYLPKIQYWAKEYSKAIKAEDVNSMDRAIRKLTYFNERHGEWLKNKNGKYSDVETNTYEGSRERLGIL